MLLLLTQVFFFLCFKACFYLLWSINFCICHLSGQIELTGNRSLKNKGGILYEQKFKLSHPSASRSRWGNGLSSQPRMGTFSCCWGFLDKDRLHVSSLWDGGRLLTSVPPRCRERCLRQEVPRPISHRWGLLNLAVSYPDKRGESLRFEGWKDSGSRGRW